LALRGHYSQRSQLFAIAVTQQRQAPARVTSLQAHALGIEINGQVAMQAIDVKIFPKSTSRIRRIVTSDGCRDA
jgi:hypothetical protein